MKTINHPRHGKVKISARQIKHPLTVGKLKEILKRYDDSVKVGVKSERHSKSRFPRTIVLCQYGGNDAEIKLLGFKKLEKEIWG